MANKELVGCMSCSKDSVVYEDTCLCPHCGAERLIVVDKDIPQDATITKPRDLFAEIEALEAQVRDLEKEVADLDNYKNDTIWRLIPDDFITALSGKDIFLSEEELDALIDSAHRDFSIDDWMEYVELYIDAKLAE